VSGFSRADEVKCTIRPGLRTALSAAATITAGALIIGGMGGLVFGQTAAGPAGKTVTRKAWTPARTPDGQPDLQGRYTRNGVGAGGTGQDGGAPWAEASPPVDPLDLGRDNPHSVSDRGDGVGPEPLGFIGGVYPPRRVKQDPNRRVGIVDPADKKLPWRPEADAKRRDFLMHTNPPASLAHIEKNARCSLPGVLAGGNGYTFLQRRGAVVMLLDYNHTSRVVHLDGRPHLGKNIRLFEGDSLGRWEGNTLVVDTTNFNGDTSYSTQIPYLSDSLHTTERFTILDAETVDYEITIDDPVQFTRPWKVAGFFAKQHGPALPIEYACAENSQALQNIFGKPSGR
jgi:hypothetical protein